MIKDIVAFVFITLMLLGWFDLGQGPEWTWWHLIVLLGN